MVVSDAKTHRKGKKTTAATEKHDQWQKPSEGD
jgi:hypothetical protein